MRMEVNQNGRKRYVTRLNLFRHAIDTQAEMPEEVDVVAVLEGTVPVVKCDVPGFAARAGWNDSTQLRAADFRRHSAV